MQKEFNLCEILKGHEGEIFYCSVFGNTTLREINLNNTRYPIIMEGSKSFTKDGKYHIDGECVLFPSKNQRDWNKWVEEYKPKIPKIWGEYIKYNNFKGNVDLYFDEYIMDVDIGNSCSALFKIHTLIQESYGRNITNEEWKNDSIKYIICYDYLRGFYIANTTRTKTQFAFHTTKQAKEFLSYPENIQLLKDFYMIQ